MPLDTRQAEEILLTSAQSFFALVILMDLRISVTEALLLFVLFVTQVVFHSTEARTIYAFVYLALGLGWLLIAPGQRQGLAKVFRAAFGRGT